MFWNKKKDNYLEEEHRRIRQEENDNRLKELMVEKCKEMIRGETMGIKNPVCAECGKPATFTIQGTTFCCKQCVDGSTYIKNYA